MLVPISPSLAIFSLAQKFMFWGWLLYSWGRLLYRVAGLRSRHSEEGEYADEEE